MGRYEQAKPPSPLRFSPEELEEQDKDKQKEERPKSAQKKAGSQRPSGAPSQASARPPKKKKQARKQIHQHHLKLTRAPKIMLPLASLPLKAAESGAHRAIERHEEENAGVQAAHSAEKSLSSAAGLLRAGSRSSRLREERQPQTREGRGGAGTAGRRMEAEQTQGESAYASHPGSRRMQRRQIRREYTAAYRSGRAQRTQGPTLLRRAQAKAKQGLRYIRRNKRTAMLIGLLFSAMLIVMNSLSSCSVLIEATLTSIASATYPSEDSDMKAAETMYRKLEEELQYELDHYLEVHPEYDEAIIEYDDIEHDPYVLISMLTALKNGKAWTIDEVAGQLKTIFDRQYIRTESVDTQIRYRNEWREGIRYVLDPQTGKYIAERYSYEASIPYEYKTAHIYVENFNLSHLPVYLMGHRQMGLYAMYMSQVGNRPDLFPGSPYIHKYLVEEYPDYEIPEEDLLDPDFAAIMAEATKYLGFPYVWGGAMPSTSFDCSGYVSYVLNQSGWNIGRLGSQSLYDKAVKLRAEDVRPGDLIFFTNTFKSTSTVTHVGIMVNDHMMIHCGDPIQYTRLDDRYHQEHFYAYGRIPK